MVKAELGVVLWEFLLATRPAITFLRSVKMTPLLFFFFPSSFSID